VVPATMTAITHNNAAYSRAAKTVMLVILVTGKEAPAKL
jgi:hypothetical protein